MKRSLLALAVILVVVPAMAQVKDLSQVDQRLGPPNFGPAGGTNCFAGCAIPDADPGGCSATGNIVGDGSIVSLTVVIQATHTWCGDLQFQLTHDGTATSAMVIDRPGYTTSGFGCSGDDYDVSLNDDSSPSVEDVCDAAVPAISGDLSPFPDALAAFVGEDIGGDWSMLVIDNAGGDTGTLDTWCVDDAGGPDYEGGNPMPAVGTTGAVVILLVVMTISYFYLRRRRTA